MSHTAELLRSSQAATAQCSQVALAEALRNDLPNIEDNEVFKTAVQAFADLGPLRTSLDCAREFKISIPAFDRWYRGVTAPHPLMRESVIQHMLTILART